MCVKSSLFNSEFYICSDDNDIDKKSERMMLESPSAFTNNTDVPKGLISGAFSLCPEVIYFFILLWFLSVVD